MEKINNRAESFFREIRYIEIYPAESYSYEDNFNKIFPDLTNLKFIISIIPEEFERKILQKRKEGNRFYAIDLNFPLLNLSIINRETLSKELNRTAFAVVISSNTEALALGNNREPLMIDLLDGIKDNGSGNDQFNISVTGQTIVDPYYLKI